MRPEDHAGNNPYSDSPVLEQEGYDVPLIDPKVDLVDMVDPSMQYRPYTQPQPQLGAMAAAQQAWSTTPLSIIDIPSTGQIDVQPTDIPLAAMAEEVEDEDNEDDDDEEEGIPGRSQSKLRREREKASPARQKADQLASLWSAINVEDDEEEEEDAIEENEEASEVPEAGVELAVDASEFISGSSSFLI